MYIYYSTTTLLYLKMHKTPSEYESNLRSYEHYLRSSEKKAWKNSGLYGSITKKNVAKIQTKSGATKWPYWMIQTCVSDKVLEYI